MVKTGKNEAPAVDPTGRLPSALLALLSPGDIADLRGRRSLVLGEAEVDGLADEVARRLGELVEPGPG